MKINIDLPDTFFHEEVRCEYTVSEKMKKIWAVQLDLAQELVRVCQKHDIPISCFAGTLLGCVRHHGFIPWDDDMDFAMTREAFNQLLSVAEEFQEPYFLQTALNDRKFFFGYARLRNSTTTGLITYNCSSQYNNGIYIDVFVLDGYTDKQEALKRQLKRRDFISRLASLYYQDNLFQRGVLKGLAKALCKGLLRCVPYTMLVDAYNKTLQQYSSETDRISFMTHTYVLLSKYWCHSADFQQIVYAPFENIQLPIFQNFDEVLRHSYGDYMEFPPVEQRGAWHEGVLEFEPDVPYQEYIARKYHS